MRYLALFPFSPSRLLSLYGYILSRLSMIAGSRVGGLTYLHLHLYPHVKNPTDHCSFPYSANFMVAVVGLALLNSAPSCCVIYILQSKLLWFQRNLRTEQHPTNWEIICIWNRNNLLICINMNTIEISIETLSWPILFLPQ